MTITLDRPTDISLDIDLSLLVGEMEEQECEHSQHKAPDFHKSHGLGPATHYVKTLHLCFGSMIYAACNRFAMKVKSGTMIVKCDTCGEVGFSEDFLEVVGKVGE